jgi:hypothetical protein
MSRRMARWPRIPLTGARSSRTLAVVVGAALVAMMSTGITLAATTSPAYQACSNVKNHLALLSSKGTCPAGYHPVSIDAQGPPGPRGPGSVLATKQLDLFNLATVTGGAWLPLGGEFQDIVDFSSADVSAQVTAMVNLSSADQNTFSGVLSICYRPVSESTVDTVAATYPYFSDPGVSVEPVTVTGLIGDLAPGDYYIGVCAANETENTDNDNANISFIVEQGASPLDAPHVSLSPRRVAG